MKIDLSTPKLIVPVTDLQVGDTIKFTGFNTIKSIDKDHSRFDIKVVFTCKTETGSDSCILYKGHSVLRYETQLTTT